MDYYQGVVTEFLRANRATFVNTEFCVQLGSDPKVFEKGRHWYCDAVALSFSEKTVYLCEITFAKNPQQLLKRIKAWRTHWPEIEEAVRRDGSLGDDVGNWTYKIWLFVPFEGRPSLDKALQALSKDGSPFPCKVTSLEETQPWKYRSWNRPIKP